MKKNRISIFAVALSLVLCLGLAGCGGAQTPVGNPDAAQQTAMETQPSGGVLCLKVNPEIAVTYDADGLVTGVDSRNEDAKAILADYTGFEGKECRTVVTELVQAIGAAGYFVEEVEGESRQITIEIESGSSLPSETFLEDVVSDVRTTVSSNDWTAPEKVLGADYSTAAAPAQPSAGTATIGSDGSLSYAGSTDYIDTDYGPNGDGVTDYDNSINDDSDYGPNSDGVTDYDDHTGTDYGPGGDGNTDYNDSDYGIYGDGVTDYDNSINDDSDYGPNSDGVTDYDDHTGTDYGPGGDGNTDYNDSDYGIYGDGVTNYTPAPAPSASSGNSNYSSGNSNYSSGSSNYGSSNYSSSSSSNYGDSGYDG